MEARAAVASGEAPGADRLGKPKFKEFDPIHIVGENLTWISI
jgi:hypothetical protein